MPKILIVDDSPLIIRLLDYMLRGAGYETVIAGDAQAALECLAQQALDMAFLDIMMPDMDGVQLLKRIRQDPALAGLPVVMLTARAYEASRREAMQAGANAYLTKPCTSDQVLAMAARYCGPPAAAKGSARP